MRPLSRALFVSTTPPLRVHGGRVAEVVVGPGAGHEDDILGPVVVPPEKVGQRGEVGLGVEQEAQLLRVISPDSYEQGVVLPARPAGFLGRSAVLAAGRGWWSPSSKSLPRADSNIPPSGEP
jgi:hypothetical protein